MSDDLIKRSDAIEVAVNLLVRIDIKYQTDIEYGNNQGLIHAIAGINELPSADRPQGEWIFKTTFPNDDSEFPMGYLECSVCGSHHDNAYPCNYCDNCGAQMKGVGDE